MLHIKIELTEREALQVLNLVLDRAIHPVRGRHWVDLSNKIAAQITPGAAYVSPSPPQTKFKQNPD